jgi:hypothetical protein
MVLHLHKAMIDIRLEDHMMLNEQLRSKCVVSHRYLLGVILAQLLNFELKFHLMQYEKLMRIN